MQEVARLTQQGDLLLSNSINERLPKITDGLIAHYPFDGTDKNAYKNLNLFVKNGKIIDSGNMFLESYNIDTTNDKLNFTGDITSWIKLDASPFSEITNGSIKFGFKINSMKSISTIFHASYNGQNRITFFINPDGKGRSYIDSIGVIPLFPAGTFEIGKYYEIELIINNNNVTGYMDGKEYLTGQTGTISDITSLVLGQEQDANYGGFDSNQSLNGYISYFQILNYINPSINTNTTLTSDGIAVEQSTTNLITDPSFRLNSFGSNLWGSWDKSTITFEKVFIENDKVDALNLTKRTSGIVNAIHQEIQNLILDVAYTLSFYVRIHPKSIVSSGHIKAYINDYATYPITKKWKRIVLTQNSKANKHTIYITQKSVDYDIQIANVQFEQKSFATSFIDGSRGDARLKLPLNSNVLNPVEGSLMLKYTPQEYLFSDTGFLDIFDCVNASTNRFLILRRNATHKLISLMFIRSGGSHIPVEIGSKVKPNQENAFIWTWKNNDKYTMLVNGELVKTGNYITCDRSWSDIQFVQDGSVNSLSIYNKALSDNEIKVLTNQPFVIDSNTHELITDSINETEDIGWILVYEGLCTHCIKEDETDYEEVNRYGDDILFDEIKITCPYWDYSVSSKLEEVAKLKKSLKYYIEWLFNQADADSPSIMFHDVNDSQHVKLVNNRTLLLGYGNEWRRITPIHYVDEASNMYNGAVDQSIIKVKEWANSKFRTHWGDQIYCNNMHHQDIPESGKFGLTPREFQTIQVWVKRVNVPSEKINCTKDTVTVKGHIKEEQIL